MASLYALMHWSGVICCWLCSRNLNWVIWFIFYLGIVHYDSDIIACNKIWQNAQQATSFPYYPLLL
jgi:hypothetical protein